MEPLDIIMLTLTCVVGLGALLFIAPLVRKHDRNSEPMLQLIDVERAANSRETTREEVMETQRELEVVRLKLLRATELRMRPEAMVRLQGKLNPYVVITLGAKHVRSRVALETTSPLYDEMFYVHPDDTMPYCVECNNKFFMCCPGCGEQVEGADVAEAIDAIGTPVFVKTCSLYAQSDRSVRR